VLPEGCGRVNDTGLDFYDALVDGLLDAGIKPFVTLYHWDLPQALQERGGWSVRDTAEAFVEYAGVVSSRLGDWATHWITHNEPWCIATLGHEAGEHAPGHCDPAEALRVAHHVLLSHGWATEVIRRNSPGAEVGIVLILTPASPASSNEADRDAVRRFDGYFNRWYLDPLFRACYPGDSVLDRVRRGHLPGTELPCVEEGDLQAIAAPLDFLGVNYYTRAVLAADDDGEPVSVPVVPEAELTEMGWEVFPQGLHDILLRLGREYGPAKIYVTENGAAFPDHVDDLNGRARIADERRVEYLRAHLEIAERAIAKGIPLRGYFAWSLLDNFEWAHGYEKRFGLYWVDYATQARLPKDSAFWYRDVVTASAVHDGAKPFLSRRPK
jgi:beta-glucosidase